MFIEEVFIITTHTLQRWGSVPEAGSCSGTRRWQIGGAGAGTLTFQWTTHRLNHFSHNCPVKSALQNKVELNLWCVIFHARWSEVLCVLAQVGSVALTWYWCRLTLIVCPVTLIWPHCLQQTWQTPAHVTHYIPLLALSVFRMTLHPLRMTHTHTHTATCCKSMQNINPFYLL